MSSEGNDSGFETNILDIDLPSTNTNHNGGRIEFGPDGYLYIAVGDGGQYRQIPLSSMAGCILRIDVDNPSSSKNYSIPMDNPTIGQRPGEVYAEGFRNPWAFSFSTIDDSLMVADVGQSSWEEVNIVVAGQDYGWPRYEGTDVFDNSQWNSDQSVTPVFAYPTNGGGAIIGGYVVDRPQSPFYGAYIFADMGKGTVTAVKIVDGEVVKNKTIANIPPWSIYNFTLSKDGYLLMVYGSGEVVKLNL
jgi:glucose/arabinose dehydrogenase